MIIQNPVLTGSVNLNGLNLTTSNLATTSSNNFTSTQTITGSLGITGNITASGAIVAQTLVVSTISASVEYSSGSNIFGNNLTNQQIFTGSLNVTGSSHAIFGNVGIGTTNPAQKFEIWQATNNRLVINYVNSANEPQISSLDSSNNPQYFTINSYDLKFKANGSEAMRITNSGNIGIGITNPSYTLDVSGTGRFTSTLQMGNGSQVLGSGLLKLGIASGNAGAALQLLGWATGYNNWQIETAYINSSFNITPSTTAGGSTFTTPAFTITSGGNVGIGTTNPGRSLEVQYAGPGIRLRYNSNNYMDFESDFMNQVTAGGGANSWQFQFNGSPTVQFNSNGNVAIGTTSPYSGARLQIKTATNINIAFQTGTTDSTGIKLNSFNDAADTNVPMELNGSILYLKTNETERFRITSNGDAGVYTVKGGAGTYKNFNWGSIGFMGRDAYDGYYNNNTTYDGTTWRLKYANYYANVVNWYDGAYSFQRSTTNGTADSSLSLQSNMYLDTAGNVTIRGSLTQNGSPSDINLKENLNKITSPLNKISQINGYTFDWKEGTSANGLVIPVAEGMESPESPMVVTHDAGLIAQEVEEIMPELVRDNGHKSLNYNGITALLVEAIKELKAEIEELKNR